MLFGYTGHDTYVFRSLAELGNGANADTVFDDMAEDDVIDLSAIDADTTTPGNQAFQPFTFVQGDWNPPQAFTGVAGQIIENYDADLGEYLVQFDVNGDAVADAALWVAGYGAATANFIL